MLLSPGSWCTQSFVCALQESVSLVLCEFWWLHGGVNGDLLPRGLMPYPRLLHPEPLWQATSDPHLLRRHSETVLAQSCGLGVHFVPFPGLSSSDDQVLGGHTVPGGPWSYSPPSPGHSVSWVYHKSAVSGVPRVSSGELISGCDPPGRCQPSRIPGRRG